MQFLVALKESVAYIGLTREEGTYLQFALKLQASCMRSNEIMKYFQLVYFRTAM